MSYLYGDLTPFPHEANYIDLIREATELCYVLLKADAAIAHGRQQLEADRAAVVGAVAEFRQLSATLAETLQPHLQRGDNPTMKEVSSRLAQAIRSVFEGAQGQLQARHESNVSSVETQARVERERTMPALEKFLVRHQLPGTTWSVRWSGGQVEGQLAEAQALATTPFGLAASFQVEISANAAWCSTIKVADVKPRVVIELPKKSRRGTVRKPCELDRYNITEATLTAASTRLLLRKGIKPGGPGLQITWQGGQPSVMPLDDDTLVSEHVAPQESEAAVLDDLRERVATHLWSLVDRRARLVEAQLGGADLAELDSPASLARAVILAIAPYCREIVMRTAVAGELALKRVVEDRRREEIYIKASDLAAIYASLAPGYQAYFDELGLSTPARRAAPPTGPVRRVPTGPVAPATAEVVISSARAAEDAGAEPKVIFYPPGTQEED